MLERLLNRRPSTELKKHERIYPQQHAFRCSYSVEALFSIMNFNLGANSSHSVDAFFSELDRLLKKA